MSDSAADLNEEDASITRHASAGEVRDRIVKTQSSGNMFNLLAILRFLRFLDLVRMMKMK